MIRPADGRGVGHVMAKATRTTKFDLDHAYQLIANEEDARACRDIPESACRELPGNFFRQLAAMITTQTGDALVNPKTVLAWLLSALGAPVAMVAWLVPLRESLSMLPQMVIAGFIRRMPRRKPVWVLGACLQGVAVALMGGVALTLVGSMAGWAILGCLIMFSLARGLCSIASKDVMGKTVPKGRRGRLSGLASSVAGMTAIALGTLALVSLKQAESATWFAIPLLAAGGLWFVAVSFYGGIKEESGATGGGSSALMESFKSLSLLRTDPPFRKFVIARALLLCSALSAPYLIVLARETGSTDARWLGAFIVAGGLASAVSASIWGWLADVSSRRVLILAGSAAAILGLVVFLVQRHFLTVAAWPWTYPLAFFLLSVAHSGVRLGRKTYVVDLAGGNKRTDYVAVGNSVIGLILLLTGSVGALSNVASPETIVLVLSLIGFGGVVTAACLPEV